MKKRNTAFVLLLVLFLFSCCFLISCSDKNNETRDTTVKIGIEGASLSNRITVYAINNNTEDEVEIEFRKRDEYTCLQSLDYGEYSITKIESNNHDFKVSMVTTQFNVTSNSSAEIMIEVEEQDVSWTLLWFWENNAFTIIALAVLSLALLVIKWRKNRIVESSKIEIK